jgi:hypothetical protein
MANSMCFQKPSRSRGPWLLTALGLLGAGLSLAGFFPGAGGVMIGVTLLGIAM